jgi:PAS domain S-box-containing protein
MDNATSDILTDAVEGTPIGIMITDPRLEDNPITYVNDAFEKITQYERDFALGRNCRFLHGDRTEPEAVEKIRSAMQRMEEVNVAITNQRADGTPFRNQLLIAPVFDEHHHLSAFFGVLRELPDGEGHPEHDKRSLDLLRELQHRVKNHLAMVVSLIRVQANRDVTKDSFIAIARRIEALALLYEEMFSAGKGADPDEDRIKAGAYLGRIANVIASLEGRNGIRVNVDCEDVDLPVDQAARLGLLLSELLTNALEHAFPDRDSGAVTVRLTRLSEGGVRLSVEDDGIGLPEGSDWPRRAPNVASQRQSADSADGALDTTGRGGQSGMGGTIIMSLTQGLGAALSIDRGMQGTIVTIDFEEGA